VTGFRSLGALTQGLPHLRGYVPNDRMKLWLDDSESSPYCKNFRWLQMTRPKNEKDCGFTHLNHKSWASVFVSSIAAIHSS